jgi:hypothetical protein
MTVHRSHPAALVIDDPGARSRPVSRLRLGALPPRLLSRRRTEDGSTALFMVHLAFGPSLVNSAKLGILEASVVSGVSGLLGSCPWRWCRSAGPRSGPGLVWLTSRNTQGSGAKFPSRSSA